MIATQELADQAIAKLIFAMPELEVILYPANPANYRLNHPLGAVLLDYPGSTSTNAMLMGRVEQVRTVRIGLTLVTRQLWGTNGAATQLDRLRAALGGWRPEDCEPVYAIGDRLLQEDAGLWWYAMEFACNTRLILPIHA